MSKKLVLIILVFVVVVVFYFSWLSDPSLRTERYLPKWLVDTSNEYYNVRTAIPFVLIGFLLEAYTQFMTPNRRNNDKKSTFIQNLGIATIIVFLAEGGQFFLQKRNPDIMDIYFGIVGSLVGGMGYNLLNVLLNFKRYKNAK